MPGRGSRSSATTCSAFTVLGFAGACSKLKGGFFIGTVVGSVARFLVHYVVGATVWAEYMPETFFGLTMTTPWFYSALYNGSFMLIDRCSVLVIGASLWKPLKSTHRRGSVRCRRGEK